MSNRVLETVKGRDEVLKRMVIWVESFNDCNGRTNRMVLVPSGLEAWDEEGSGEFYLAVCLNMNTAESCAEEIWQIEGAW